METELFLVGYNTETGDVIMSLHVPRGDATRARLIAGIPQNAVIDWPVDRAAAPRIGALLGVDIEPNEQMRFFLELTRVTATAQAAFAGRKSDTT